jgi:chromosome segregation ATPase
MGGTASKANKITPLSAEGNSKPLQQQITQLQNELESGKKQNAQVHQQLESSKQLIAQLQQQLESCKQQNTASLLQSEKQQIAQLQNELDSGKQQNDQLQQRIENDQPSTAQFALEISLAAQRKDEAFMREIFNRHATKEKLCASALTTALKNVAAPMLADASSEGSCDTADYVFRRADANMSGDVDFAE